MNNKGFAISIILYSLVFLLVSIFYMLLGIVKTRYTTSSELRRTVIEQLNDVALLGDMYNLIKESAGSKSYIASYDDVINSNPTYTTQDTVGTNSNKKTVYYYTGDDAAANANVLFAGFCWQIIRTTDTGGIRMIYNGVAQNAVTGSTPITSSDITATNDGTYPYTYNATTKKWTSANSGVASSTDTFIFTVNTAGSYAINYKVSTEYARDIAKFYKNDALIGTYSGSEESIIDLGTLAITDTIKVEYTKNDSNDRGTDNVIFSIETVTERSRNPVCAQGRTVTKGINGQNGASQNLSETSLLYGRSYDYNLVTGKFTIKDSAGLPTVRSTTNDSNNNGIKDYLELIGTYTCLSTSATCSTLYYVGKTSYVVRYTIGDVSHFSQMGTSPFNSRKGSPALNGYMFNDIYNISSENKSGEYFATATWNGTSYDLTNGNGGTAPDATHHYICNTTACTQVRYYYYVGGGNYIYVLPQTGETIEDAIYKMTGNGDAVTKAKQENADYELNHYNSSIKGYLENWYAKNLADYSSYLDETSVYCNDRSIVELGGWNPNGTSLTTLLQFKQHNANNDLNCINETDRFAVTNTKATLTYPIGLLTESERYLMGANFARTGQHYWNGSPHSFESANNRVHLVYNTGGYSSSYTNENKAVRGVITLKSNTKLENGSGTYLDPYVVGPIE